MTHVVGLDPNPGVEKIARPRINAAPVPVEFRIGAGERLPFPDGSFDTVVTFLVLCSVENPEATLKEIRRVLAPGGSYLLVEHGLAPDASVQKWQRRINGLNKIVLGGCNLNRPIRQMVTTSGFTFQKSREFFHEKAPKFAGYRPAAPSRYPFAAVEYVLPIAIDGHQPSGVGGPDHPPHRHRSATGVRCASGVHQRATAAGRGFLHEAARDAALPYCPSMML